MSKIPTDEQVGMTILAIFGKYKVRPGEMLKLGVIRDNIERYDGFRIEDVSRGVKWLLDNGHIEQGREKGDMLFLTQSGFDLI